MSAVESVSATPETVQTLIAKHQDAFRNLRTNGSSERELRGLRRAIAELALKQKSLYDAAEDRDNNSDEVDAIVLRTTEDLPDKAREQALFLRRLDLLLIDTARALEAKREARKRRRTALNATMVTTASGRTELLKRRTTRPLRSTFVSGANAEFLKSGHSDIAQSSFLRGGGSLEPPYLTAASDHADGDIDVLDIDIAVSAAKMRMRRCKLCHAGGEVDCCSRCDAGYHVGICVPSPNRSSKSFTCPDCTKKYLS